MSTMTEQGRKALTAALRIIAANGKTELVTIEPGIRSYFASASLRGEGMLEAAINVVVEAIEKSAG
ncbi:MAG TPA: hypothetical protein VGN17_12585 [Bryobacteraceae bacterium]|jgi:hypothetical protein